MTEREYKRLYLDGYNKRQAGTKADANPYAGKASLRRQADAWDAGWIDANVKMRARR